MRDWALDEDSCRRIAESDYHILVRNDCKPLVNDVLIAKDGSYLKHAFVVEEEKELVILSSIAILRPNLEQIFPHILCMYLRQPEVRSRLSGYVSGVALPRIILKDFAKFLADNCQDIVDRFYCQDIVDKRSLTIE
jgi:type I restriction enzyme S subunit